MVYVRISGRVELQVAGLSGLGAIGNYNQVATAKIICCGSIHEVPVLTGNALKHWHSVYTAEIYEAAGGKLLNDLCRMGVGFRGYTHDSKLGNLKPANNECEAICDLCNDLHGFLIAAGNRSAKRDSLIKTSFMVPVMEKENLEAVSKFAVQHNRVVPESVRKGIKDEEVSRQAMMVFKQEYATGLYGFNIRLDLVNVLKPLYESCNIKCDGLDEQEAARRKKAAVTAILPLLTGSGSKQARALPIANVRELLAAVSPDPLPNLIHGAYPDYLERSIEIVNTFRGMMEKLKKDVNVKLIYWGPAEVKGVERAKSLDEFFNMLVEGVKG